MLTSTFCCFSGLNESAEQRLWQQGCLSWSQFMREPRLPFKQDKIQLTIVEIKEAQTAFNSGLYDYFITRLPSPHKVRVLFGNAARVGYLDIETTGLSRKDKITTISLLINNDVRTFVEGRNLSEFLKYLREIDIIVTFNGKKFDIPFIEKNFSMNLFVPQIDLLYILKSLGCSGGLKQCEKMAGVNQRQFQDVDGKKAIQLWQRYENEKDTSALEQLILYNIEDVLALQNLAVWAYKRSLSGYPKKITKPKMVKFEELVLPIF